MGPLVPDIIGNDLNFIVALLIGILFGAILEQAGFSSSRKLVGLFYGYDFTVLRVFLTAGITAMVGVMFLVHYGLLDINLVYVNPAFIWSGIVGGVIMGLGFVLGGYCPGTSVCAAAIGKIDAILFIAGSFIGVLLFTEGYPIFEGLYKSYNLGNVRMFETLGISQSLFAFLMVAMALFAFWMTSIIENKVNGIKKAPVRFSFYYVSLAATGVLLSVSAFMFPDRKASLLSNTENIDYLNSYSIKKMTIDEFAYRLMDTDNKLQVIDLRNEKEYTKFNLPKSTQFSIDNLFEKEPNQFLSLRHKINVFVADNEIEEKKAAVIANELGYNNIQILEGGLTEFRGQILNYNPPADSSLLISDTNRFRLKASKLIKEMIQKNKSAGPVKKTQKRVVGGC